MTHTAPAAPAIYALTIERFRGITFLKWKPSRGVKVILGGGPMVGWRRCNAVAQEKFSVCLGM